MILYADSVEKNTVIDTDICIIGAGAAGLTLAVALQHTYARVLILESGDMQSDSLIQHLNEIETTGLPVSEQSRARQFGGTTTLWAGRWKPHDSSDFETRSWIPESGWPMPYHEISPYYQRSSELLGSPPLDTYKLDHVKNLLNDSTLPLLHNDTIETSLFNWLAEEDWNWGKMFRSLAESSKNITVFLRACVVNLGVTKTGIRVDRVAVKTLAGNNFVVRPQQIILAGGGIENARLLLLSREVYKNGLGNTHDQVGRYYMDHPKGIAGEIVPKKKNICLPVYWGITSGDRQLRGGLRLSRREQECHEILNSYVLLEPVFPWSYNPGISMVIGLARLIKKRDIPLDIVSQHIGNVLKNQPALWKYFTHKISKIVLGRQARVQKITVWNFMEQEPCAQNRVALSKRVDELGCSRAKLHWEIGDRDRKTMIVMHQLLKDQFLKHGIGTLHSPLLSDPQGPWPITNDASHHMGTTRMGIDPKTSVVDVNCRVHGIENLYIAGSSVFPMSGYANPTATICALAIRLADHLISIMPKNNTILLT